MTQLEEVLDKLDWGYSIDQVSILMGINKTEVEKILANRKEG